VIALRGLHRDLRPWAEYAHRIALAYGLTPRVTSVYRSWQKQAQLRRNFEACVASGEYQQTARCRWPANRPGDSAHNYGLAWDSVVSAAEVPLWRAIREAIGFRVPQNDQIHSELPGWRAYVS